MFLDPEAHPLVRDLAPHWPQIADELSAFVAEHHEPVADGLVTAGRWSAFGLLDTLDAARDARWSHQLRGCTATLALARRVVGLQVAAILRMAAGTRLLPHRDLQDPPFVNFHLLLQVDSGRAWLRVGPEVRRLHTGDCYAFDPRTEHEAGNDGDRDRVLLYLAVHRHAARLPLRDT